MTAHCKRHLVDSCIDLCVGQGVVLDEVSVFFEERFVFGCQLKGYSGVCAEQSS